MSLYPQRLFNVVLVEPEIPNNTGNVGRTCVGLWSKLHLVGPLGFSIDDKQLKRAGLDYWQHLELQYHKNWSGFINALPSDARLFFFETGGTKTLFDAQFLPNDYLIFGKETKGISQDILADHRDRIYEIPFPGEIRSFNLANTVAMVMCEGFRQLHASGQITSKLV
ncbi:MAG: tRNA (cytidine(34)-2'-O)-methyltransferase [Bdellovibrionota bacterium]